MDEHLARGQAADLIGRHAAVCAADPEVCRSGTTSSETASRRTRCTTQHSHFGVCCSARFLKNVGSAAFMLSTHVLLFSSRFSMSGLVGAPWWCDDSGQPTARTLAAGRPTRCRTHAHLRGARRTLAAHAEPRGAVATSRRRKRSARRHDPNPGNVAAQPTQHVKTAKVAQASKRRPGQTPQFLADGFRTNGCPHPQLGLALLQGEASCIRRRCRWSCILPRVAVRRDDRSR
jgi:hypothetical protein